MSESETWAACLRSAAARLEAAGIEGAMRDARRLLAHVLGGAEKVLSDINNVAHPADKKRFLEIIERRKRREPVSHILGLREFFGRDFIVNADVLDPRPETETLVSTALEKPFRRVLDLGCGSGCILLTLLAERPEAVGTGVDISDPALAVARRNCARLGLERRARFERSDWFSAVRGRFDLIVTNPPYVSADEMQHLAPELRLHEPGIALSPGGDGLGAYRRIAAGAARHLTPEGRLLAEIGATQGPAVVAIFEDAGFRDLRILPDLDGRDRVVACRPPATNVS